jgi:hypothetical protein
MLAAADSGAGTVLTPHPSAPAMNAPSPQWWDTLSRPSPLVQAARDPHLVDLTGAEFVVCESVKHSGGSHGESFARINALAEAMLAARGSGFGSVIRRGPDGDRIDAPWLTSKSYACDLDTGRVATAAHLNHAVLDLPPGLDLGAGQSWPDSEEAPSGMVFPCASLYFGSTVTGALVPIVMGFDVVSVDLSAATGDVAMFESWGGSTGAITVVDPWGQRRLLTLVEDVTGGEHIRYSSDGTWLLLDSSGSRSWLVDSTTGQWLDAPVDNVAWWPLAPSTLLTLDNETKPAPTPRLYSLETAAFTKSFPALQLVGVDQTDPDLLDCYGVSVSPAGTELLVGSRVGITHAYQQKHGSRQRVARVNLATGHGALVWPIFLDGDHELETEHEDFRWLGRRPVHQSVTLHADLLARVQPAKEMDSERGERNLQRAAYDARQVAGLALQHAKTVLRERPQTTDPSPYMPEVIRGLVALHDLSPDLWPPFGEWIGNIKDAIQLALDHGLLAGRPEDAWRKFSTAAEALQNSTPQFINWHELPWLTYAQGPT